MDKKKIDPNLFMKGKRRKPTVCYPFGIPKENVTLWGYYFEESNIFFSTKIYFVLKNI